MLDVENHRYQPFIRALLNSGLALQWDENAANISSGTYFKVHANFSYNEYKIYLSFPTNKTVRIFGRGEEAAEYVVRAAALWANLEAEMDSLNKEYEG